MPYTVPSVAEFRARFPAFKDETYTHAQISAALSESSRGAVGRDWIEADYQPAIMYHAAHSILAEAANLDLVASPEAAALGTPKSVTIEGRTVSFATSNDLGGAEASQTPSADLKSTFYGLQYLKLLRRNVAGVLVTNAASL